MQKLTSHTVTTQGVNKSMSSDLGKFSILIGVAFALTPVINSAADFEFSPRIQVGQTWTDNVSLAEDDLEESEWITEVRPGLTLSLEGPRFSGDLNYEMQILRFDEFDDLDDVFNQLDAKGNLEVLPDSAFVDAFARYGQQLVSTEGRRAYSNLFETGNRTDYAVFGLSPYHSGSWGSWGESMVRLTAYGVRYENTDEGAEEPEDSDNLEFIAAIGSPEGSPGLNWGARGSYTNTDFDEAEEFKYAQTLVDMSVPMGFRSRLTGTVGKESDVEEDISEGGLDETVWLLGFIWKPSDLQSLEVRGGDRFYGTAWEASWQRRGSKGELTVDYTEDPTTSSGVVGDEDLFIQGFPTIDIGGLDSRVFLQKRLSGQASYELTRSVIAARVYSDKREYLDVMGGDEDSLGFTLSFDWDAAARTRVGASATFENRELELNRDDDYGEFELSVTRQINKIFSAKLGLSHFYRDSNVEEDYDANLVSLLFTASFGGGGGASDNLNR
jgi:hypothetical protein